MDRETLQQKISDLDNQIRNLANQLVANNPQGRHLIGKREALQEVLDSINNVPDNGKLPEHELAEV
jgi:hypothetical protein